MPLLSVENQGIDNMVFFPTLGQEWLVFLEHLSHVNDPNTLRRTKLKIM